MGLLQEIKSEHQLAKMIVEEFELQDLIDKNGAVLTEGTFRFFAWAKNILERPTVSDDQIKRDPTVDATEADPVNVKDAKDAFTKLAKTLAGLKFYSTRADDEVKKLFLSKDKDVEKHIKAKGEKSEIEKIILDLQTKRKSYVKKLLGDMEKFYRVNGYGVA